MTDDSGLLEFPAFMELDDLSLDTMSSEIFPERVLDCGCIGFLKNLENVLLQDIGTSDKNESAAVQIST